MANNKKSLGDKLKGAALNAFQLVSGAATATFGHGTVQEGLQAAENIARVGAAKAVILGAKAKAGIDKLRGNK